jgi:4-aminobutyrate aminotransferase/(S)-3-amino-2-methylpropionate transaminase
VTQRFLQLQQRYSLVGDVRGLGGMAAIELVKDRTTKEPDAHAASDVLAAAHQRGLVLIKAGMYDNVLRILVPLVVTDEQLKQGLDIFEDALAMVAGAEAVTSVS